MFELLKYIVTRGRFKEKKTSWGSTLIVSNDIVVAVETQHLDKLKESRDGKEKNKTRDKQTETSRKQPSH